MIHMQVLQIAEALLKQSDVLTGPGEEDLPYISPTARFLDQVAEHFSIIYEPGQVGPSCSAQFWRPCHPLHSLVSSKHPGSKVIHDSGSACSPALPQMLPG